MPNWLIVALIIFVAAPGAAILLFGVYALFRASGPDAAPAAEPEAAKPEGAPLPPIFGEAPVTAFPTVAPLIAAESDEVIDVDVAAIESEVAADESAGPFLPPPADWTDDKDVT